MQTLSKGEFAAAIGVSPGRVSQYIAEGKIGPNALDGEGRSARIIVPVAMEQIRLRRDVGQSLGNGLQTKLFAQGEGGAQPQPTTPSASPPPPQDDVALQIQRERLKSERRKNERDAVDEAVRQGQLVPADEVRRQMMQLARQVDEANGAMLADFASAIASKFGVSQRDVLHLLREVRNQRKGVAAAAAKARAEEVPETVEFVVEDSTPQ